MLMIALAVVSCKKKDSGAGIYTLSASINGDSTWTTTGVTTGSYAGYVYIHGVRSSTGEEIDLTLANYSGVNKYDINNMIPDSVTTLSVANYVAYGIVRGFEAMTGSITVSQVTQNALYGSYYFMNTGGGSASGTFVAPHP
jgi:hypothetical protein